jgi:hypothetical protein
MSFFDKDNNNEDDNELDYIFQQHHISTNGLTHFSNISIIDSSTPIMYNSVNVLVGRRTSGKIYTCIKDFIKNFRASERTDLLVYISKNPNVIDPTFDELKQFMNFPKVFISANNAETYIKHLIAYKTLYEKILNNEEDLENYSEEDIEDLLTTLAVDNFDVKGLNTLIFLDDSANSKLLKSGSYISSVLSENRQPRLTFFINIQYLKGISASIKPNINLLFIFGTFLKQQVNYILQ